MLTGTMKFFVEERISEKRSLTPEGYLLCESVPIARTGELLYVKGEVPVEADDSGLIIIERPEAEVFADDAIKSFEGKSVTLSHPDDDVNPENWRELSRGTVQNVRRGMGIYDDCLVADLLITDKEAIESVQGERVEVSCGYDAAYEQVAPGRGVQRHIVGNHVALLPKERGRCGPRCSIGDQRGVSDMADPVKTKKPSLTERLLALALNGGARTTDEEGGIHLHLGGEEKSTDAFEEYKKSSDERFGNLEKGMQGISDMLTKMSKDKDPGDPDEEKTSDEEAKENEKEETSSKDTLAQVIARAEILSPGLQLSAPTFDSKKPKGAAKRFRDAVCGCKRQALEAAYKTEDGKAAISPFVGGVKIADLTEQQVDLAFIGASEVLKSKNNGSTARKSAGTKDFGTVVDAQVINKRNTDFWKTQGVR